MKRFYFINKKTGVLFWIEAKIRPVLDDSLYEYDGSECDDDV